MKYAFLVQVETNDAEIERINEGRKKMRSQLWEPYELVNNAIREGLDKKFIKSVMVVAPATEVIEAKVGDEVV